MASTYLMLGGCATPHLYPICYYNTPPSRIIADAYSSSMKEVLVTAVNGRRDIAVSASPDGRWLVANVTRMENKNVSKVWPRLGCIGDAVDSHSTRQQADCAIFVKDFVATEEYITFGNAKDAGGIDIWSESRDNKSVVRCHRVQDN